MVLRRQAVLSAGNYRPGHTTEHAEDYDLWARMAPLGDMHNLKEPLVSYRISPQGVTAENSRLDQTPGYDVAVRTTEITLGRALRPVESQLIQVFYKRRRRIKPLEALQLYQVMFAVVAANGLPPALRAFSWRQWLAPLAWVIREHRAVGNGRSL